MSKIFDNTPHLALLFSMSNIFDTENRMSRLSFQEKMLWAQLLAISICRAAFACITSPTPHPDTTTSTS